MFFFFFGSVTLTTIFELDLHCHPLALERPLSADLQDNEIRHNDMMVVLGLEQEGFKTILSRITWPTVLLRSCEGQDIK